MFSTAYEKSLNLIRLTRNCIRYVVVKEKAFVRLDLNMCRHNCIIFAITIQFEGLGIEGIVRCLIGYVVTFACYLEI